MAFQLPQSPLGDFSPPRAKQPPSPEPQSLTGLTGRAQGSCLHQVTIPPRPLCAGVAFTTSSLAQEPPLQRDEGTWQWLATV